MLKTKQNINEQLLRRAQISTGSEKQTWADTNTNNAKTRQNSTLINTTQKSLYYNDTVTTLVSKTKRITQKKLLSKTQPRD